MDHVENSGRRNFLGAAVGGFFGLLGLSYLGVLAMIAGCFVGVILGFWYRELWNSLRSANWPSAAEMKEELGGTVQLFQNIASEFWTPIARPFRWLGKHPMNVITTVRLVNRVAVFVLWFFATALLAKPFAQQTSVLGIFLFLGVTVLPSFGLTLGIVMPALFNSKEKSVKFFYSEWELFSRLGPPLFALRDLTLAAAKFTWATLALATAAIAVPIWSLGFFCVVLLPLGGLVSFLRVFWWAAARRNHWPCLVVTIATTATTGWLLDSWLEQEQLRWLIALGNGLLCGILAEVAVKAMSAWHNRSEWYQAYAHVPLKRRLGYYGNIWLPSLRFFLRPVKSLGPAM